MSLQADPSPVKASDETPALYLDCNLVKQRTHLSHAEIPDLKKLWDNKCVCIKPAKFMIICYAIMKNANALHLFSNQSIFVNWISEVSSLHSYKLTFSHTFNKYSLKKEKNPS